MPATALRKSLVALSVAVAFTTLGIPCAVLAGLYPVAAMWALVLLGEAVWAAKLIRRRHR